MEKNITNDIIYVGVDDKDIGLFEGQYDVPNGVSYNSYIIKDEKIAVMDTVDTRKTKEWLKNLENELGDKEPDYLVILHAEPDHAGNIETFLDKYKNAKIVSNPKTFVMIGQFFENLNLENRKVIINDGDVLSLGKHHLTFVFAPMVHWPEVMVAYDNFDKVLFSADGFGKFGTLDTDEAWDCEARRYYINIVGKYGKQVQSLLKKAATLDIEIIAPLHGPILAENLEHYINKYDIWSSYRAENEGVFIAYASVYGNTEKVAFKLKEILEQKSDIKVSLSDLTRDDMAEAVEDAFRYDRLILASITYDGGIFPCMDSFIHHLKSKNYQNRQIGFIENGSWASVAAKKMKTEMESLKEMSFFENIVSIKSAMKKADIEQIEKLADEILGK